MKNWIRLSILSKNNKPLKSFPRNPYLWGFLLIVLIFQFSTPAAFAQKENKKNKKERNASVETKEHSPHKATLWALIPGAGQIYNKKYWKLPIVYAGFGVITYFVIANSREYRIYNDAYICSSKADSDTLFTCTDPLGEKYDTDYLKSYRDYYRRNLELTYIIMGAWYILQMLDATVDAHLFHWEVDDNISVRLDPIIQPVIMPRQRPAYNGLRVTMRF